MRSCWPSSAQQWAARRPPTPACSPSLPPPTVPWCRSAADRQADRTPADDIQFPVEFLLGESALQLLFYRGFKGVVRGYQLREPVAAVQLVRLWMQRMHMALQQ